MAKIRKLKALGQCAVIPFEVHPGCQKLAVSFEGPWPFYVTGFNVALDPPVTFTEVGDFYGRFPWKCKKCGHGKMTACKCDDPEECHCKRVCRKCGGEMEKVPDNVCRLALMMNGRPYLQVPALKISSTFVGVSGLEMSAKDNYYKFTIGRSCLKISRKDTVRFVFE